jgi:hypothetical protein
VGLGVGAIVGRAVGRVVGGVVGAALGGALGAPVTTVVGLGPIVPPGDGDPATALSLLAVGAWDPGAEATTPRDGWTLLGLGALLHAARATAIRTVSRPRRRDPPIPMPPIYVEIPDSPIPTIGLPGELERETRFELATFSLEG